MNRLRKKTRAKKSRETIPLREFSIDKYSNTHLRIRETLPFVAAQRQLLYSHQSWANLCAAESLDDDVVSVVADDDHGHDGTGAKHRAQAPVNVTGYQKIIFYD